MLHIDKLRGRNPVVDIAIEISQAFEAEILKIEAGCLIRPEMGAVRHLHVISSQLTRLKRTLSPLSRVLYTLRNRDQERALASLLYGAKSSGTTHQLNHDHGHHSGVGHMTEKTGFDTPGGEVRESLWSAEDSAGYISRITKVRTLPDNLRARENVGVEMSLTMLPPLSAHRSI